MLELAHTEAFARPLVNSGRLSRPTPYAGSPLVTPDDGAFSGSAAPGAVCPDAPVLRQGRASWLLDELGCGFTLLSFGPHPEVPGLTLLRVGQDIVDAEGLLTERYDGRPGTTVLVRPDHHVAARWRGVDPARLEAAWRKATCR